MKTFYLLLFLSFTFFIFQVNSVIDNSLGSINAKTQKKSSYEIDIISREEWWADESYRYLDSDSWKSILEKRANSKIQSTKAEEVRIAAIVEKKKKMNEYINTFFLTDNTITSKEVFSETHKLAWPIQKTDYVKAIIVHHTHSQYTDSYEWIRDIYKYHSTQREWGDIGYNYIIWNKWEIFEGRAGGDYVVGAHAVWNNRSTVSIALMWDFDKTPISIMQYKSLKNLVRYLSEKYGINLNDTFSYHKECIWTQCKQPIMTSDEYTLIGHRDAGHTNCPWEVLYKTLQTLRKDLAFETKDYKPIKKEEK